MPSDSPSSGLFRRGFRLVAMYVRNHPGAFSLAVTGSFLYVGAIVASAWVIGRVTDEVIIPVLDRDASSDGLLLVAFAAILSVAVVKAVGIIARRASAGYLQAACRRDIRLELIATQLRLRLRWFNRRSTGDLLAVAETDALTATGLLAPLPFAIGVSFLLVGSIGLIFAIDWGLGVVTLLVLALAAALDLHGAIRMYAEWERIQIDRGKMSGVAHESFDGALTVRALGRVDYETDRFAEAVEVVRAGIVHIEATWANYRVVIQSLPTAGGVIMLVVGAAQIDSGLLTAGDLITVIYLMSLLAFPIQLIGFLVWDLAASLAGWERVKEVTTERDFVEYGTERAAPATTGAPVAGEGIDFAYEAEPVLAGLDLDIPPGRTVAIVGATGSGKSTLTLLMARLWDPDQGNIRLDGRDLRAFARSELPNEVSIVMQESFLFDDTVAGNVTLGDDFTDDEIRAALRLAGADEFVDDLPDGIATRLGERGTTLSGGQRQRIALARALIRRPRLLIMDDATSAVDPSVEADILKGLAEADLPSTVVIVAYRPASIRLADEVVFVRNGRIAAHATHERLLRSEPAYAQLVQAYESTAAGGAA